MTQNDESLDVQIDQSPSDAQRSAPLRARRLTVWLLLASVGVSAALVLLDAPGRAEDITVRQSTSSRQQREPRAAHATLTHTPEVRVSTVETAAPADLSVTPAQEEGQSDFGAGGETLQQRQTAKLVQDGVRLLEQYPRLARELFALAASIEPRNPHAHAGCAEALLRLQRPAAAQLEAEAALRIRPKRASYRVLLQSAVAAQQPPAPPSR